MCTVLYNNPPYLNRLSHTNIKVAWTRTSVHKYMSVWESWMAHIHIMYIRHIQIGKFPYYSTKQIVLFLQFNLDMHITFTITEMKPADLTFLLCLRMRNERWWPAKHLYCINCAGLLYMKLLNCSSFSPFASS